MPLSYIKFLHLLGSRSGLSVLFHWSVSLLFALVPQYFNQRGFIFFNYIFLIMLLQLSQVFPLCLPPPSIHHPFRQSPHHCSCLWVMIIGSLAAPLPILYFTSPWLFCTYLFVVNPLMGLYILNIQLIPLHCSLLALVIWLSFFK